MVNMDPQTQKFVEMQGEIQALREELLRQRTALMSATESHHHVANLSSNSKNSTDELESRLETAQLEIDHYKKLVKEAYNRFKQMNKTDSSVASSRKLVDDWLNMFEACKNREDFDIEDYAKQKILQLEAQLKQALDDLKSDEEIFADREKELSSMKDTVNDLEAKLSLANRYLEASYNKEKEQQELMIQLQIQLDKTMQNKKQNSNSELTSATQTLFKDESETSIMKNNAGPSKPSSNKTSIVNNSLSVNAKQRAKTAPNEQLLNEPSQSEKTGDKKKLRSVYSSPAIFNLERVMQNFRARSQLLAETLEENDCVLQKMFNSTFDVEVDDLDGKFIENGDEDLEDETRYLIGQESFINDFTILGIYNFFPRNIKKNRILKMYTVIKLVFQRRVKRNLDMELV